MEEKEVVAVEQSATETANTNHTITETSTVEQPTTDKPAVKEEKNKPNKPKDKPKKKDDITVPANKKGEHIMPFMNFLRILCIPIFWLLMPFKFYGNKFGKGACIYVCNHYTLFDCVYVAATTWEGIHIMAKKENFDSPFLGWFATRIKAIRANRDGNDARAVMDSIKCLRNGEKLCIFPEGTRNKTDAEILPFHHGAAAIAIMSKKPIVPMMIYERPKMFKCTHVLIGEPIELSEYYGRKLTAADYEEADNKVRNIMLKMREDHRNMLESKKK